MFELQAISSGENVALNKTAVQSSTILSRQNMHLALDGDTTTFSHTDDGNITNAFWEADLGTSYPLESILIDLMVGLVGSSSVRFYVVCCAYILHRAHYSQVDAH
jgi:hypothetical protein